MADTDKPNLDEHNLGRTKMDRADAKQLLTLHEATRRIRYFDSIRRLCTVGVGCNLDDPGARATIATALPHINFDQLYKGEIALSDADIETLLDYQLDQTVKVAQEEFPNFDAFPEHAQLAIVDMLFNLGEPRFDGFRKFKAAVSGERWAEAIAQLINSAWYHQVPERAKDDITLLKQLTPNRFEGA